jgi:hypothetical protein
MEAQVIFAIVTINLIKADELVCDAFSRAPAPTNG